MGEREGDENNGACRPRIGDERADPYNHPGSETDVCRPSVQEAVCRRV